MEEFPYYGLSWFLYLLFAVIFLVFCTFKTGKWSIWVRVPLLTFIAALSFTPGITVTGESWWSPAAIIMIFELDQKGLAGIWRSLLAIIAVWLIMMVGTVLSRWWLHKKNYSLPSLLSRFKGKGKEDPSNL